MLPPTANESKIFTPGQESSIVSINGIKIAIVICYELEFPELIRELALQDVQLIIAQQGSLQIGLLLLFITAEQEHLRMGYL